MLNEVFGFPQGRGLVHGMLKDLLLLLVMGILFIASILVTDLFVWLKILLMVPIGMPPGVDPLGVHRGGAGRQYRALLRRRTGTFPIARSRCGPRWPGPLLASVLWEAAKQLFRWYIMTLGVYDRIYGPLGALVALSMFVYYSGIVFVLGAEFAAAFAREEAGVARGAPDGAGSWGVCLSRAPATCGSVGAAVT